MSSTDAVNSASTKKTLTGSAGVNLNNILDGLASISTKTLTPLNADQTAKSTAAGLQQVFSDASLARQQATAEIKTSGSSSALEATVFAADTLLARAGDIATKFNATAAALGLATRVNVSGTQVAVGRSAAGDVNLPPTTSKNAGVGADSWNRALGQDTPGTSLLDTKLPDSLTAEPQFQAAKQVVAGAIAAYVQDPSVAQSVQDAASQPASSVAAPALSNANSGARAATQAADSPVDKAQDAHKQFENYLTQAFLQSMADTNARAAAAQKGEGQSGADQKGSAGKAKTTGSVVAQGAAAPNTMDASADGGSGSGSGSGQQQPGTQKNSAPTPTSTASRPQAASFAQGTATSAPAAAATAQTSGVANNSGSTASRPQAASFAQGTATSAPAAAATAQTSVVANNPVVTANLADGGIVSQLAPTSSGADPMMGFEDVSAYLLMVLLAVYKDNQGALKSLAGQLKGNNDAKAATRAQIAAARAEVPQDADKIKNLESNLDTLGDDQQLIQLKLQQIANLSQQTISVISDWMKNENTTKMNTIHNLAG